MSKKAKETAGAVELHQDELETVSGGLLLPAVQKVREAANRSTTTAPGVNVALGDGSVRT